MTNEANNSCIGSDAETRELLAKLIPIKRHRTPPQIPIDLDILIILLRYLTLTNQPTGITVH